MLLGKIAEYLTVSVFVLTLVAYEWMHWYFHWKPQPLGFGLVGMAIVGYACIRVGLILPRLRSLKLETAAAWQFQDALQQLSLRGCYVFNDVATTQGQFVGTLVVAPAGVFCLLVRYLSRSHDFFEGVTFQAPEQLTVGGHPVPGTPCVQIRRMCQHAGALLEQAGLPPVPVQPIVVFPAWTIKLETPPADSPEPALWVVNETSLIEQILSLPPTLEPKTVIELCTCLERRVLPPRA